MPHPDKFPNFIQDILAKMSLQFPTIKRTIIASGPEYPFLCETDHRGNKIKTTPNDIKAMDSAFDHFSDVILLKWKYDESTSDPTSLITTINESYDAMKIQAGKYPLWKNKSKDFCDYHDDAVNGRERVDDKFMVSLFPPKPDAKK